jgi:hypothetical protein
MSSKATLENLVKKVGAELDLDYDYVGVMAPRGKVFEPGVHYDGYGIGRSEYTKAEAYRSLIDGLRHLVDCQELDCRDCLQK